MRNVTRIVAALALGAALAAPLAACSLCGIPIKRDTLGQEYERASLVLLGRITASRLSMDPLALPGAGSSDFEVDKVFKAPPDAPALKKLDLPGYIPILDKPPRYVFFCSVDKGKPTPLHGREVRSDALLEYLTGAATARAKKDRAQALLFHARYLDHADDMLAEDAFMEFAKSADAEVAQAAVRLDPAFFRKLIDNPRTPPERLSLFCFLLAGAGDPAQAEFLKSLLDHRTPRIDEAIDGVLCGYIALRPKEGWAALNRLLCDPKQPFKVRHNALRAVRFYHNWKPKEAHRETLAALKGLIETDLIDLAVEELRRWQAFDFSTLIYKQYARAGFDAPIIRRSIIRYALVARRQSDQRDLAQRFLDNLPAKDRDIVREIEDSLAAEGS